VADLGPEDFGLLRAEFAKGRAPASLALDIALVKRIVMWCYQSDYLEMLPKFGPEFARPGKLAIRKSREAKTRILEADQLRAVIDAATQPWKTMIVLAINAGLGRTDLGRLTWGNLDLEAGLLRLARSKTQIPRTIPLWPEVVAMLREIQEARGDLPAGEVVFQTDRGRSFQGGDRHNIVARHFQAILKDLGFAAPGLGFYSLRRVTETAGGNCRDQVAVDQIMGHRRGTMDETYREWIDPERLKAVTDAIHAWLWPPTAEDDRPDVVPFSRIG
jgi:integrase